MNGTGADVQHSANFEGVPQAPAPTNLLDWSVQTNEQLTAGIGWILNGLLLRTFGLLIVLVIGVLLASSTVAFYAVLAGWCLLQIAITYGWWMFTDVAAGDYLAASTRGLRVVIRAAAMVMLLSDLLAVTGVVMIILRPASTTASGLTIIVAALGILASRGVMYFSGMRFMRRVAEGMLNPGLAAMIKSRTMILALFAALGWVVGIGPLFAFFKYLGTLFRVREALGVFGALLQEGSADVAPAAPTIGEPEPT